MAFQMKERVNVLIRSDGSVLVELVLLCPGGRRWSPGQGDRWLQAGVMSFICGIVNVPDGCQSWIQSQITSNRPGFVFAGSSGLVSRSVPLLFAVSLFGLMLF